MEQNFDRSDLAWYTSGYLASNGYRKTADETLLGEDTDPLSLQIDDKHLCEITDKRIDDTRAFNAENLNLYNRRTKNVIYLFGKQLNEKEFKKQMKKYEPRILDNVLWEIESTMKPLAMSQLPDLIITPGQNTDEARQIAKQLTTAIDTQIKERANRFVLGLAFKHRSALFEGVLKCVWNPELAGGLGDYEFIVRYPDQIDHDHTVAMADANKMEYVADKVNKTVAGVLREFPKAKAKFVAELKLHGFKDSIDKDGEPSWEAMATPIVIREVWFTDYKEVGDGEYEKIEGTLWKYEQCILGKMKNPYFDYEGHEEMYVYDEPQLQSSRRALTSDEMQGSMLTGQFPANVQRETVYNNYFEQPEKPYFFMVYDQWGQQPMDETTALEQNIRNQESLDEQSKIIQEKMKHRGHFVWSKMAGFKKSHIEKMDHNNPEQDYLVNNIPRDAFAYVPADEAKPQEFNNQDRIRERMYGTSGSQAVRGEIEQNTTATNNQIAREGNYTRADDLVEDTINPATEWMARWAMQMIKTRYTQEHFRRLLGKKGEVIFIALHQNMVDQGMLVMVKASGSDKIRAQNNAQNDAKLGLTDPLSYYEDMNYPDPEGRTARLITYKSALPLYLSAFVETGPTTTPELIAKLQSITQQQQQAQGQPGGQPQPGNAAQPPQPGQQQPPSQGAPQNPSPNNTGAVAAQPPAGPPAASPRAAML